MMNKKGGEKLLSLWWFFVLIVIGGGIVIGVLIYHTDDLDVRGIEAASLSDRVILCISDSGNLNSKVLQNDFDLLAECGFNKEVFEKGSDYYLSIEIRQGDNLLKNFEFGDSSQEANCGIAQKTDAKEYPRCSEKSFVVLAEGNVVQIKILAASIQEAGRVPVSK